MFFDGILEGIVGILNDFFYIPKRLFRLAFDLLFQALRFLLLVSDQFPGVLLDISGDIFDLALDLVFIDNGDSLN